MSLIQRVQDLEKASRRKGATETDWRWDEFRVSVSIPPDKRIHMRGGVAYAGLAYFGEDFSDRAWFVPARTADLTSVSSVFIDVTFSGVGTYQAHTILIAIPTDPQLPSETDWNFRLVTDGNEYATALEAEAAMDAMLDEYNTSWPEPVDDPPSGMPLSGLILRSETSGPGCPILPIDPINRGRSYLYQDIRPQWLRN